VLALTTSKGLSSPSDQDLQYGRTCITGRGCDKTPCIHYLSYRHKYPASHFAPYLLIPRVFSALYCATFRKCAPTKAFTCLPDCRTRSCSLHLDDANSWFWKWLYLSKLPKRCKPTHTSDEENGNRRPCMYAPSLAKKATSPRSHHTATVVDPDQRRLKWFD
jgi:hypothetical protein